MNKPLTESGVGLQSVPGLEQFIDRLEPGMDLDGRIVDTLGEGIFILRIWGNNILAESSYPFKRFDEVILHVRAVKPRLIFDLRPRAKGGESALYA